MGMINSDRSLTGLVEKYIGTAYDHVKYVADNMEYVIAVAGVNSEDLAAVGAISEEVVIVAGIADEVVKVANIDTDVATVSVNVAEVQVVADPVNMAAILLCAENMASIQAAAANAQKAEDNAGYAEEWANKPEDELISADAGGDQVDDYSSLHFKNKTFQKYTEFDARYLGAFATPPTLDNQGQPLNEGALYWDTVADNMRVWDGVGWTQVSSASITYAGLWECVAGDGTTEYPATVGETAFWVITNDPSYTFATGQLTGQTVQRTDYLIWNEGLNQWEILNALQDLSTLIHKDGSVPMVQPLRFQAPDGTQEMSLDFQSLLFNPNNIDEGADPPDLGAMVIRQKDLADPYGFFLSNNGNVGINFPDPTHALSIKGQMKITTEDIPEGYNGHYIMDIRVPQKPEQDQGFWVEGAGRLDLWMYDALWENSKAIALRPNWTSWFSGENAKLGIGLRADGGYAPLFTLDVGGRSKDVRLISTQIADPYLHIGKDVPGATQGRSLILQCSEDDTQAFFIWKENGVNKETSIAHRGEGPFYILSQDSAPIYLATNGVTRMVVDKDWGGIGINMGEDAPYDQFHMLVDGNSSGIMIDSKDNEIGAWLGCVPEGAWLNGWHSSKSAADASGDNPLFLSANATRNQVYLAVNGNVGINTSNPEKVLHVVGDILNDHGDNGQHFLTPGWFDIGANTAADTASGMAMYGTSDNQGRFDLLRNLGYNGNAEFYNSGTGSFLFKLGDSPSTRMIIKESGSVGIGTTSPGAKLHVAGDILSNGKLTAVNVHLTTSAYPVLQMKKDLNNPGNYNSLGHIDFVGKKDSADVTVARIRGQTSDAWSTNNAQGELMFYTKSPSNSNLVERMRITELGKVGIGVTDPLVDLHVDGSGYFSGNLDVLGGVSAAQFTGEAGVGTIYLQDDTEINGDLLVGGNTTVYNPIKLNGGDWRTDIPKCVYRKHCDGSVEIRITENVTSFSGKLPAGYRPSITINHVCATTSADPCTFIEIWGEDRGPDVGEMQGFDLLSGATVRFFADV